jgi:putative intracellular protease/amidase
MTVRLNTGRLARIAFLAGLLAGAGGMFDSVAIAQDAKAAKKQYVCPPCPVDCHDAVFDEPGTCPVCRMTLIEKGSLKNVAIMVWNGVELLDFAGPGEVFAAARAAGGPAYNVFTVGITKEPILSQGFVRVTPQYSIEDSPPPDILVLPGGGTNVPMNDANTMAWVKRVSNDADVVMSVCTGAFILARLGLLNGLEATTWHGAIEDFRRAAPNVTVLENRRYVDNGDVITAAGVSAGIDAALHVVRRMIGPEAAKRTARYMEYEWSEAAQQGRASTAATDGATESAATARTDPTSTTSAAPSRNAEEALADLEAELKSGRRNVADVLGNPELVSFREQPAFRELIKVYSRDAKTVVVPPGEPGDSARSFTCTRRAFTVRIRAPAAMPRTWAIRSIRGSSGTCGRMRTGDMSIARSAPGSIRAEARRRTSILRCGRTGIMIGIRS